MNQVNPFKSSKSAVFIIYIIINRSKSSLICIILICITSIAVIQCKKSTLSHLQLNISRYCYAEYAEQHAGQHARHENYDPAEHDIDAEFLPEDFFDRMYDE